GTHLRVLNLPAGQRGFVIQVGRSLDEVDSILARIKRWLIVLALIGIAMAAGLGLLVARAVLAPVQRLTKAAEDVSVTGDLSQRIDANGKDGLSRLGAR